MVSWSRSGELLRGRFKCITTTNYHWCSIHPSTGVALGLKNVEKKMLSSLILVTAVLHKETSMKQLTFFGAYQANGVFIIQNNGFAISTPREKQTAAKTLAQKLLQQEFLVFKLMVWIH